jgi:hypothetical protein
LAFLLTARQTRRSVRILVGVGGEVGVWQKLEMKLRPPFLSEEMYENRSRRNPHSWRKADVAKVRVLPKSFTGLLII